MNLTENDKFDPENLRFMYAKYHERELFDINQIWENLKFLMTITTIFVPILTGIPFLINLEEKIIDKIFKISFITSIVIFLFLILFTIKSNSERHYKRWAEWRGTNIKISEKLNLNEKTNFTVFPEDNYLHPFKYINPAKYAKVPNEIKTVNDFIRVKFSYKDSFINKIKKVYWFTFALLLAIYISLLIIFCII